MAGLLSRLHFCTCLLLCCSIIAAGAASEFVGCFGTGSRDVLPEWAVLATALTPSACADAAAARGLPVYGLKGGTECWMGTDLRAAKAYGPSTTGCNTPCAGDATATCGGAAAISLHRLLPEAAPPFISTDSTGVLQGCYADAAGGDRRMSPLWADDRMTPAFCGLLAKHEGALVFGLKNHRECWVSSDLTSATALGTSTACTSSCLGDTSLKCGGSNALSIYTVPDFTKLGCYQDSWDRMLPQLLQTSGLMTPTRCAQLAKDGGYTVFGLQNAVECWAGTDIARAKSLGASAACTSGCYNAPAGDCGGTLASSVFVVGSNRPASAAPALSLRDFTAVGCYSDNIADRALPTLLKTDVGMTVDVCAKLAKAAGHAVFGLQWGQSCWAGASETAAKKHGAATTCNSQCWWHMDTVGSCGGTLSNTLYTFATTEAPVTPNPPVVPASPAPVDPTPVPNPDPPVVNPQPPVVPPVVPPTSPIPVESSIDVTPLGCYGDAFGARALPIVLGASPDMTVDECAQLAYSSKANYPVFGVQYASECMAGRSEETALRYGPSAACNMACHGTDATGTCGGPLANSLYRLPPKPVSSPSPPAVAQPGQTWTPQGCYSDAQPRVVAVDLGGDAATMTHAECARRAKAAYMTVFAIQYGGECRGGDDLEVAQSAGALPDDSCYMPCGGADDEICGGPNANSLFTIPPPVPPEDVPPYTYLGCFTDDQVIDDTFDPPTPIKRRMWRRLGQRMFAGVNVMDSWECSKRALAAGYPLFGITSGETYPNHGWQCWGAFDEAYVTALGPSDACTNACKSYKGADRCGGNYAISLYRLTGVQYDTGSGGVYETQMEEFAISAVHMMQVTGRDEFLLIDFLGGNHPAVWDGANTTYMWRRNNNTQRSVLNIRDASCGMWIRLPEGDFAGFSGYFGASGVNHYSVWATMYHRHQFRSEDFGERAMPYGRWYGGAVLLPDGRVYVTGGDMDGPGSPRALGSEVWDPAHKSYVGRATTMGLNQPYLPINDPLFFASNVGGYYPGLWPLHSGGLLFSQATTVQVINPSTGEALAAAPPLVEPYMNYWEYPLSGPAVLLKQPVPSLDGISTFYFMIIGGGWQAAFYKPCTDFSLRIRLDVDCTNKPCTHTFGAWEVETMPGPRGMADAITLPNGKLVIIGGTEEGFSNLDYLPNSNNVPVNEPWEYDPAAPAGHRYRRTGVYTRIGRFYHGSHIMTSYGDILCGGSTIARGFTSYHMADFDVTPFDKADFRIELFKPTYVLGPRPAWASVPTSAEFGATFTITLAANTTVADIVGVVMTDPGTATHSSTMSTRTMDLAFVPAGGQSLTVTAPANIHVAQPGFYLLFAVARDGSYSVGKWIRIKGPWGSRPYSLPAPTQFVAAASSHFELNFMPWTVNPSGSDAVSVSRTAAAAGSGAMGMSVAAGGNAAIVLAGPALNLAAGSRVHTYLWARGPNNDVVQLHFTLLTSANLPAAATPDDAHADISVNLLDIYQHFTLGGLVVSAAGFYYPAINITGLTAGQVVSIDDLEVYTLTQADAATSLQLARAGTPVNEQIAPAAAAARRRSTRRRLQGAATFSNSSTPCVGNDAWAQQPELQSVDLELKAKLDKELQVKLRTGQHAANFALAGMVVKPMVHTMFAGGGGGAQGGGMPAGHGGAE